VSPKPLLATKDDDHPIVEQAPGVRFRLRAGASTGAEILTVADRWFEPGAGVLLHTHPEGVEEVVWVQEGQAEFEVDGETAVVGEEHTVIIPAGASHRYTSCGDEALRVLVRWSSIRPVMNGEGIEPGTLEIDG
jgi:quercetin dioxygenase-like cupin family protein